MATIHIEIKIYIVKSFVQLILGKAAFHIRRGLRFQMPVARYAIPD